MITAICENGHRLKVPPKYAGKKIRCPRCQAIARIPMPVVDEVDLSEIDLSDAAIDEPKPRRVEKPADDDWDDDEEIAPAATLPGRRSEKRSRKASKASRARKEAKSESATAEPAATEPEKRKLPAWLSKVPLVPLVGSIVAGVSIAGVAAFMFWGGDKDAEDDPSTFVTVSPHTGEKIIRRGPSARPKGLPGTNEPKVISSRPQQAANFTTVALPATYFTAALDQESGNLAAISEAGAALFSKEGLVSGKPAQVIEIEQPAAICWKPRRGGSVFLVSQKQTSVVYVLSAADLSVVSKVELVGAPAGILASSTNKDDQWGYYVTAKSELCAIDVEAGVDKGALSGAYRIAVSPDGGTIFTPRRMVREDALKDGRPSFVPAVLNYFETLGVSRNAGVTEITRAYRRIEAQSSPDVAGNDPQAAALFEEATAAYKCLMNRKQRRAYESSSHPGDNGLPAKVSGDYTNQQVRFDSFGQYVGAGKELHSVGPYNKVHDFDFEIKGFSNSSPVIFGLRDIDNAQFLPNRVLQLVQVRCRYLVVASYNSYDLVGEPILLQGAPDDKSLAPLGPYQMLIDNVGDRVLYLLGDKLVVLPFSQLPGLDGKLNLTKVSDEARKASDAARKIRLDQQRAAAVEKQEEVARLIRLRGYKGNGVRDLVIDPDSGMILGLDSQGVFSIVGNAVRKIGRATAIGFKNYKGNGYFVVANDNVPQLRLLDSRTRKELASITLKTRGLVDGISVSQNENDPTIYYHVTNKDPRARKSQPLGWSGAVSLDDNTDKGKLLTGSQVVVASSGKFLRSGSAGLWGRTDTPLGSEPVLEQLAPNVESDAPVPKLAEHLQLHQRTIPVLGDDRLITGRRVYAAGSNKKVSEVPFFPAAFLKSPQLCFGYEVDLVSPEEPTQSTGTARQRSRSGRSRKLTPEKMGYQFRLSARSSDTFQPVGPATAALVELVTDTPPVMVVDPTGSRVVVAIGRRLGYVPFGQFGGPATPLMTVTATGGESPVVGRESRIQLAADERVSLRPGKLLDGMQVVGDEIVWTPTPQQVGKVSFEVELKYSPKGWPSVTKAVSLDRVVEYPSQKLPFAPAGGRLLPDRKVAVWGRSGNGWVVAVVDLDTGAVEATTRLPQSSRNVVGADGYLVAQQAVGVSWEADLLDLSNLEVTRKIRAGGPIREIRFDGESLLIATKTTLEVWDPATLKQTASFEWDADKAKRRPGEGLLDSGFRLNGVLYRGDGERSLIGDVQRLVRLGRVQTAVRNTARPRPVVRSRRSPGPARIPGRNLHLSLIDIEKPDGTYKGLQISGDLQREQALAKGTGRLLLVGSTGAAVIMRDRLFEWQAPEAVAEVPVAGQGGQSLRFVPEQSAFVVKAAGTTELSHKIEGGKGPFRFAALNLHDAISVNTETGQLTINGGGLKSHALQALVKHSLRSLRRGSDVEREFEQLLPEMMSTGETLIKRKPTGVPVAVPVTVVVSDANLDSATLKYFVILEVPQAKVVSALKAASQKKPPARAASELPNPDKELQSVMTRLLELEKRFRGYTNYVLKAEEKPTIPSMPYIGRDNTIDERFSIIRKGLAELVERMKLLNK